MPPISWREELPDPVDVPLQELSEVVQVMEIVRDQVERAGHDEMAEALDGAIGQMMRWIWPLLGELDEED